MNNCSIIENKIISQPVKIVSFKCILRNQFGKILSSSFNNDVLADYSGETHEITQLIQALQTMQPGEKRKINLKADQAYGFYDPKKLVTFSRKSLPQLMNLKTKPLEPIQLNIEGVVKSYVVADLNSEKVVLDGNHPFAGQDLIFELETLSARDATLSEISSAAQSKQNPSKMSYH